MRAKANDVSAGESSDVPGDRQCIYRPPYTVHDAPFRLVLKLGKYVTPSQAVPLTKNPIFNVYNTLAQLLRCHFPSFSPRHPHSHSQTTSAATHTPRCPSAPVPTVG